MAERDPIRSQAAIDTLAARVREANARFEQCDYPCGGHLFAEPGRDAFNGPATELMVQRVLAFLDRDE